MEAKKLCMDHLHRYVCIQMEDGNLFDGIVEHVDDDMVYLAVPVGPEAAVPYANQAPSVMPSSNMPITPMRGFYPGYGYPQPYPYPYPYPYYGYGRRRFNRLVLPLFGLVALSLLPYY
ncbi:hypothetical protein [Paenibacillus sp. JJ-223]|uniref:hypothetical protein n=1 Tax=Paenibacillus sp. JJ-223 TaxID=2905647 RepID=UPI001F3D83BD|nr:hypothetical protein [Paenibacillus sp. JJ-223]